jgi:hypothetical protein
VTSTRRWLSIEQSSGRVIAELPNLIVSSALKKTLGGYEQATVDLPIATAPDDWERATQEDYAALVALDDDRDTPLWGGLVTKSDRSTGPAATVEMTLNTAEWYLSQRYVADIAYQAEAGTAMEQCTMVVDLVNRYAVPNGLPFQFDYLGASGTMRERTYRDMDNTTVYAALQNLMGVDGGPEWTINWAHIPAAGGVPERYVPVLFVRDRISAPRPAGAGPAAAFAYPDGNLLSVKESRSHGANDVMATGSSQMDYRPQSSHHTDLTGGGPRYDYRWSPSSSITEIPTLDAHAAKALPILKSAQRTITLVARRRDAQGWVQPRLGDVYDLGDDISFDVEDDSWPNGLTGIGRCISWELPDEDTVIPILAVDTVGADA